MKFFEPIKKQWMKRIDRDLTEIRETRAIIQTKILNIEATLEGKV